MKTRLAGLVAIASVALLAPAAFAQPAVPTLSAPNVPAVQDQPVENPAPPDVPNAMDAAPVVPIEKPDNYCSCPTTFCASGNVDSCEIYCQSGESPVCSCDGFCDENNNPKGLNRCDCQ